MHRHSSLVRLPFHRSALCTCSSLYANGLTRAASMIFLKSSASVLLCSCFIFLCIWRNQCKKCQAVSGNSSWNAAVNGRPYVYSIDLIFGLMTSVVLRYQPGRRTGCRLPCIAAVSCPAAGSQQRSRRAGGCDSGSSRILHGCAQFIIQGAL